MFARSVSFQLKPGRAAEFTKAFETDIIPVLRKQKGFQDEITLIARRRQGSRRHQSVGSEGKRRHLRACVLL